MRDTHRVLVTSSSSKVPLIGVLRKSLEKLQLPFEIVGGDSNPNCVSKYFVDDFWIMPKLNDLNIESLIDYLKGNGIRFVIPTRDLELSFFSQHKNHLAENHIHVMVSDISAIEMCLDKLKFYQILSNNGYPVIPTSMDIGGLQSELFVTKERFGAGAKQIGLAQTREEAVRHAKALKCPVFQPFIRGTEVSVDAYIDKNRTVKGMVLRTRDLVVNGESQVTTSFSNYDLELFCKELISEIGLYGHCVLQLMIDADDNYHIIECNSRFGGASSLSHEMGLESFYWFILEAMNTPLDKYPYIRSKQEKRMVRFSEDLFICP